jgi:hypothetical protein
MAFGSVVVTTRPNNVLDFFHREFEHIGWVVGFGEQQWCDLIHAFIGALGAEEDGN